MWIKIFLPVSVFWHVRCFISLRKQNEVSIMVNKSLFQSLLGRLIPAATVFNEESAPAYEFGPEHGLAQYAVTGTLNGTFYASAKEQLSKTLELCAQVEPRFIAQTAVFCREQGHMKDMPALLCAVLAVRDPVLLAAIFSRVIDNGKMLKNFVQIIRSGAVGRKSFGTVLKRLVRNWLEKQSDGAIFRSCVGRDPSLADVIKMVHPKPLTKSREALYGYLVRGICSDDLPEVVKNYEDFKAGRTDVVPNVPMEMLTALELSGAAWGAIARNGSWLMTLMNLNTFARHGVFADPAVTKLIADRLRDPLAVAKAKVFPYRIMAAYCAADDAVPSSVKEALQDALEIALANVPAAEGRVVVCPDVSGSMASPVTGQRKGATTALRCIDVAALFAAAILRKNPDAAILPFEDKVCGVKLNPRDSVATNAEKLAALGGGGTNLSAPLVKLNREKAKADLVVFISDNQSWMDAEVAHGTATMREWSAFKARNPKARLVCIDLQPYGHTQAVEREDILNVGGFSDQVFTTVGEFARGRLDAGHWVSVIKSVVI